MPFDTRGNQVEVNESAMRSPVGTSEVTEELTASVDLLNKKIKDATKSNKDLKEATDKAVSADTDLTKKLDEVGKIIIEQTKVARQLSRQLGKGIGGAIGTTKGNALSAGSIKDNLSGGNGDKKVKNQEAFYTLAISENTLSVKDKQLRVLIRQLSKILITKFDEVAVEMSKGGGATKGASGILSSTLSYGPNAGSSASGPDLQGYAESGSAGGGGGDGDVMGFGEQAAQKGNAALGETKDKVKDILTDQETWNRLANQQANNVGRGNKLLKLLLKERLKGKKLDGESTKATEERTNAEAKTIARAGILKGHYTESNKMRKEELETAMAVADSAEKRNALMNTYLQHLETANAKSVTASKREKGRIARFVAGGKKMLGYMKRIGGYADEFSSILADRSVTEAFSIKAVLKDQFKFNQQLSQTAFLQGQNRDYAGTAAEITKTFYETGLSREKNEKALIKVQKMGVKDRKKGLKMAKAGGVLAKRLNLDSEQTAEWMRRWHVELDIGEGGLRSMGIQLEQVAQQSGLVGENFAKVVEMTKKTMDNLKGTGSLTQDLAGTYTSMMAEASKKGDVISGKMQEITELMTGDIRKFDDAMKAENKTALLIEQSLRKVGLSYREMVDLGGGSTENLAMMFEGMGQLGFGEEGVEERINTIVQGAQAVLDKGKLEVNLGTVADPKDMKKVMRIVSAQAENLKKKTDAASQALAGELNVFLKNLHSESQSLTYLVGTMFDMKPQDLVIFSEVGKKATRAFGEKFDELANTNTKYFKDLDKANLEQQKAELVFVEAGKAAGMLTEFGGNFDTLTGGMQKTMAKIMMEQGRATDEQSATRKLGAMVEKQLQEEMWTARLNAAEATRKAAEKGGVSAGYLSDVPALQDLRAALASGNKDAIQEVQDAIEKSYNENRTQLQNIADPATRTQNALDEIKNTLSDSIAPHLETIAGYLLPLTLIMGAIGAIAQGIGWIVGFFGGTGLANVISAAGRVLAKAGRGAYNLVKGGKKMTQAANTMDKASKGMKGASKTMDVASKTSKATSVASKGSKGASWASRLFGGGSKPGAASKLAKTGGIFGAKGRAGVKGVTGLGRMVGTGTKAAQMTGTGLKATAAGVKGAGFLTGGLKFLGRAIGPLAAGLGAFTGYMEAEKEGRGKIEGALLGLATGSAGTDSTLGSMVGLEKGTAGNEAMGLLGGAASGAMVGSMFGPVGAAIGAGVGLSAQMYKVFTKEDSPLRKVLVDQFGSMEKILTRLPGPLAGLTGGFYTMKNAANIFGVAQEDVTVGMKASAFAAGGVMGPFNAMTFGIFDDQLGPNGTWTQGLSNFFNNGWEMIAGGVKGGWDMIKGGFSKGWEVITGLFSWGWESITYGVSAGWEAVTGFFSSSWEWIKGAASKTKEWVVGLGQKMWSTVVGLKDKIINGVRSMWGGALGIVIGFKDKVVNGLIGMWAGVKKVIPGWLASWLGGDDAGEAPAKSIEAKASKGAEAGGVGDLDLFQRGCCVKKTGAISAQEGEMVVSPQMFESFKSGRSGKMGGSGDFETQAMLGMSPDVLRLMDTGMVGTAKPRMTSRTQAAPLTPGRAPREEDIVNRLRKDRSSAEPGMEEMAKSNRKIQSIVIQQLMVLQNMDAQYAQMIKAMEAEGPNPQEPEIETGDPTSKTKGSSTLNYYMQRNRTLDQPIRGPIKGPPTV